MSGKWQNSLQRRDQQIAWILGQTHTRIHTFTHAWTNSCINIYLSIYMYTYTYSDTHTHIYIYIHIHLNSTFIHTDPTWTHSVTDSQLHACMMIYTSCPFGTYMVTAPTSPSISPWVRICWRRGDHPFTQRNAVKTWSEMKTKWDSSPLVLDSWLRLQTFWKTGRNRGWIFCQNAQLGDGAEIKC